jgi:hypothetical protein
MSKRWKALIGLVGAAAVAGSALFIGTEKGWLGSGPPALAATGRSVAARVDLVGSAAAGATPTSPVARSLRVALYGDSLAFEAQEPFVQAVSAADPAASVRVHVFGGTAICDWLDQMRTDAATWRPQVAVVEFSGNVLTACMHDATGSVPSSSAILAHYTADTQKVVGIFAPTGARLYFVSYPISRGAALSHTVGWDRLNFMYASLAGRVPGARFVEAGRAVEDRGRYTDTLPCLASEPCTGGHDPAGHGINLVRAPDGMHFCPDAPLAVRGVTGGCSMWSSGALRYGQAMAAPVVDDFATQKGGVQ